MWNLLTMGFYTLMCLLTMVQLDMGKGLSVTAQLHVSLKCFAKMLFVNLEPVPILVCLYIVRIASTIILAGILIQNQGGKLRL